MRKGNSVVCWLLICSMIIVSMSGCASSSGQGKWQNAKKGSLMGALGGAVVGLATDRSVEGVLIGAAAGAVAGALIGAAIDYHQQKNAPEVYKEYGKDENVIIEDMQLSKDVFNSDKGDKGELSLQYAVIDPDPDKEIEIVHTIEFWQGSEKVLDNIDKKSAKTGGYFAKFPVAIPKGADEGEYKVIAKVSAQDKTVQQEKAFRVYCARNEHGELQVASITPY